MKSIIINKVKVEIVNAEEGGSCVGCYFLNTDITHNNGDCNVNFNPGMLDKYKCGVADVIYKFSIKKILNDL